MTRTLLTRLLVAAALILFAVYFMKRLDVVNLPGVPMDYGFAGMLFAGLSFVSRERRVKNEVGSING